MKNMFSKWLQSNDEKFMSYIKDIKSAEKQLVVLYRQRNVQFTLMGVMFLFMGLEIFIMGFPILGFASSDGATAGNWFGIMLGFFFAMMGLMMSLAVLCLVSGLDTDNKIKMIKIAMYLKESSAYPAGIKSHHTDR